MAIRKARKKPAKMNRAEVLKHAVLMAEAVFPEPGRGKDKRQFVVELINDKINLPLLNERQEEVLIGALVDLAVQFVKGVK